MNHENMSVNNLINIALIDIVLNTNLIVFPTLMMIPGCFQWMWPIGALRFFSRQWSLI